MNLGTSYLGFTRLYASIPVAPSTLPLGACAAESCPCRSSFSIFSFSTSFSSLEIWPCSLPTSVSRNKELSTSLPARLRPPCLDLSGLPCCGAVLGARRLAPLSLRFKFLSAELLKLYLLLVLSSLAWPKSETFLLRRLRPLGLGEFSSVSPRAPPCPSSARLSKPRLD